mgnify:FL=1
MTSSINEKIVEQIKAKKVETKILENPTTEVTEVTPVETTEPVRARNEKGHLMGDDESTPDVNEAWEGGKAPKAQKKVATKKTTAKKATAKKKATTKKTK